MAVMLAFGNIWRAIKMAAEALSSLCFLLRVVMRFSNFYFKNMYYINRASL